MAFLTFWQERTTEDSHSADTKSIDRVTDRLGLTGRETSESRDGISLNDEHGDDFKSTSDEPSSQSGIAYQVTVVDAVTKWDQGEESQPGWDGQPENLDPKFDSVVRCVALARQVSRAFRLVSGDAVELVSYERLPIGLLLFHAMGRVDPDKLFIPQGSEWHATSFLTLNHSNTPPRMVGPSSWHEVEEASAYWMRTLRAGMPAVRARESLVEANIAMRVRGDYADSIVKANTGCEVMIDAFLSAMMWEENLMNDSRPSASAAAESFEEGRVKQRVSRMIAPRLKGDWSSRNSPYVRWREGPHSLRHRIVHGGYDPTRQEASDALAAVDAMIEFLFDSLARRRNEYKRSALLLVGQDGLQRRGLMKGAIERFHRDEAAKEAPWVESWAAWHRDLVAAASKL